MFSRLSNINKIFVQTSKVNFQAFFVILTREHRLVHMCTTSFLMGRICTILCSPNLFLALEMFRTNTVLI